MAAAAPRKRQLVKGARTRAMIKDAVLGLYGRSGWEAVTLNEIFGATGLTVGAFYFHFDSKDQVIEEIAIETCQGYHAAIVEELDWTADFFSIAYNLVASYYQGYVRNPVLTHLMYSVIMKRDNVHAAWLESRKPLREKLEAAIVEARGDDSSAQMSKFTSHWLLSSVEDFVWAVFMSKGNDELTALASGPDTFIRQQAMLWYRAVTGVDSTHQLARRSQTKSKPSLPKARAGIVPLV